MTPETKRIAERLADKGWHAESRHMLELAKMVDGLAPGLAPQETSPECEIPVAFDPGPAVVTKRARKGK